jgi:hypothetical protein
MNYIKQNANQCYYACIESIAKDFGLRTFNQNQYSQAAGHASNLLAAGALTGITNNTDISIVQGPPLKNGNNPGVNWILKNIKGQGIILVLKRCENGDPMTVGYDTHAVRINRRKRKCMIMDPDIKSGDPIFVSEKKVFSKSKRVINRMRKDNDNDGNYAEYYVVTKK